MGSHVTPLSSQLYSLDTIFKFSGPDMNDEECTNLLPGRGVTFEGCKACEMHDTIVHTQLDSHILHIQYIP